MSQSVAPEAFDVPGLGKITRDQRFGWYTSNPIHVKIIGRECSFILDGYADDERKAEFHTAIANFLGLSKSSLADADQALSRYYKDYEDYWAERGEAPLDGAEELWKHVTLGRELTISRRRRGDRAIYVSVECECAWEEEHGLQLVFKNGLHVNKLGGYDGHLTNSDAYGDPQLENVIYRSFS